jgi:hypothetical protein
MARDARHGPREAFSRKAAVEHTVPRAFDTASLIRTLG